jgi:transcriptional regulator with XRE-family HTH domain
MFKPTRRQQAKLIKVLVEARKKAKLTQEQLSLKIHASDNLVNKFERGNRDLSFFEFHALAKAMDRDPIELAKEVWSEDD